MTPERAWLDTDLGLGTFPADIDDGLAVILALKSPEIAVEGLSTIYGNVKQDVAFRLARALLGRFPGPRPPVYPGARSAADCFRAPPPPAVLAMKAAIEQAPGEITLVPIGPLTNVAALLWHFPGVGSQIKQLVIMGGAITRRLFLVAGREFNFYHDPAATDFVLTREVPTRVFGLEVCCAQQFTEVHFQRLRDHARKDPVCRYLLQHARRWLLLNKLSHGGRRHTGFYPFDPVAVAYLIAPELYRFVRVPLRHTPGRYSELDFRLKTYVDRAAWAEHAGRRGKPASWVHYATRIDSPAFMDLLLDRLGA